MMTISRYSISLFICLILLSCGKPSSIIGRWKEVRTYYDDSVPAFTSTRILEISADSTFILDDGSIDSADTSGIPGWHAGGKLSGTWRMPDNKHLELKIFPQMPEMKLRWEIIKLTGRELEIIFPGWKEKTDTKPLRYTRL